MIESKAFYRRIEQAFAGCGRARTRERFAARLGAEGDGAIRELTVGGMRLGPDPGAAHGGGAPFEDDVTLLMVRRT